MDNSKVCRICKKEKHFNEFRTRENGVQRTECKECERNREGARARRTKGIDPDATFDSFKESKETDVINLQKENLIKALISYAGHNLDKLHYVIPEDFWIANAYAQQSANDIKFKFKEIKKCAEEVLREEYGLKYPTNVSFGEGTYLVVGDSHGKHMKTRMFQLLHNLDKVFNFDKIIHLGHILDEDSVMSYYWRPMEKVTIITKKEELTTIVRTLRQWDTEGIEHKFDIIRDEINLGNLKVRNQDQFPNEYTTIALDKLEQLVNQEHTLVNFHRHEMFSLPTWENETLIYMSPGCLCEQFVSNTKRIFDFTSKKSFVEVFTMGFNQYRRRNELKDIWEQGLYIVHVDKKGQFSVVPCRIQDINTKTKAIAYMDMIITSDKTKFKHKAETFNIITGDAHVPRQDPKVSAIINKFIKTKKFDKHINLGDVCQNDALNHHNTEKGCVQKYMNTSVLADFAKSHAFIKKTLNWAKEHYLIFANHERFVLDFVEKWPQFAELLNINVLLCLNELKIKLIGHKDVVKIDGAVYLHGDLRGFGQRGKIYEKVARNYNATKNPIFIGHIHYPCIRFGCYAIGMMGLLDQDYNEPTASRWMHGFGLASSYKGVCWNATIPIIDNILYFSGEYYQNVSKEEIAFWENPKKIDFKIRYEY